MEQNWKSALRRIAAVAALGLASSVAGAVVISGNFATDDELKSLQLRVDTPGTVSVTSFGYGGGMTGSGTVAGGGFDTMLSLFSAGGQLLAFSDDGLSAVTDPVTGLASDAGLSISLGAGSYTLVLSQYDNFPNGFSLGEGFARTGQGNFTPALSGCSAAAFCDSEGNARTSHWTLEVTGVSAVPELPIYALFGIAAVAGGIARRFRAAA